MELVHTRNPRASGAEKPSFEEVYTRYYPGALAYVAGKLGNEQEAEDLCSEAFFYCFDHYDSYDPEKSSVSTWLYLVINSRLKNYYRDKKHHVDIDELQNILPDDSDSMEQAVYLQQLRDLLARAIGTLSETQQKIVIMSYYQQKTSAQIAEELGMTAGNVRVQLSRALDKLEKQCQFLKI